MEAMIIMFLDLFLYIQLANTLLYIDKQTLYAWD